MLRLKKVIVSQVIFIPLVIMILVATSQLVVAGFLPLSPWKGGGFGMFSTIDAPQTRRVLIFFEKEGVRKKVPYKKYRDLNKNFRVLPTESRFHDLIETFLSRSLHDQDVDSVVFEYWKMEYRPEQRQVLKNLVFFKSELVRDLDRK